MEALQTSTRQHYQRVHERQTARSISSKSSLMAKPYITPILNFKQSHQYILNSPFCITSKSEELITAFAYPNLSKFHESVDLKVKI